MKGRQIRYSDQELAFIEWRQTMSRRALHAAFVAEFGRDDIKVDDIKALCTRRGWKTGRTGCFEKGLTPANKGKRCPEGKGGRSANARKTQFKTGELNGRAKAVVKPIGAERISKDGYIERKINNDLPFQRRWRMVQVIRWEQANGPIPEGHALKSLDGNRQNTDPSNWIPVPRAMLPRLNGRFGRNYDNAPADLKPTILAVARLEIAALERRRGKKEPGRPGRRPRTDDHHEIERNPT